MSTPKNFLKAINQTEQSSIDLSDPIYGTEIFQLLAPYQIKPTDKVRQIIKKCSNETGFKTYIKDTINRCKQDFERNPSIDNQGGYILDAIEKDYHKPQREVEDVKIKREQEKKNIKEEKKKIELLIQEGKASFYTWRKPFISKLRNEYLNDELIEIAIRTNAKDAFYRKAIDLHRTGKVSKMIDKWVDDYLALEYLEPEFSNVDSYLEKKLLIEENGLEV